MASEGEDHGGGRGTDGGIAPGLELEDGPSSGQDPEERRPSEIDALMEFDDLRILHPIAQRLCPPIEMTRRTELTLV